MAEKIILTADLYDNAVTERNAITQRSPVLQEQCETIRLPNASWQEVLNCDWIQSSISWAWAIRKR